jgi:GT2 family glycosyltransferase/glycosyltransferase involved in cell wall biosynthesis
MAEPDAVQARRAADAAEAWARGRAAQEAHDAIFWLERTARLAPDDPRPALEAALIAASIGVPEAPMRLADIALGYQCATAWRALARWRWLEGDGAGAAAALQSLCARHVAPDDFAPLADAIVAQAGAAGWCAIRADGRLRLGALRAKPVLRLDGHPIARLNAQGARQGRQLTVQIEGVDLLGSPIDLAALRRVEGVVAAEGGDLVGWAFRRAAPALRPSLVLRDAMGADYRVRLGAALPPVQQAPFHSRFGFRVRADQLAGLTPPFVVRSSAGEALYGSPIDPALLGRLRPRRARVRRNAPQTVPARAGLVVVMPIYRDAARTKAALDALAQSAPGVDVLAIDDASPEAALRGLLNERARAGAIILHRLRVNRGFPGAVNRGLAVAADKFPGHDIVLLNADTLVPEGALARLQAALYQAPDIGSVTPLSNEATIVSYPHPGGGNPPPDMAGTTSLNALAWRVNGAALTPVPTAVGFCMVIRHDCLAATGSLRAEVFAQGYGEENDWCRRAQALGYRHMAASGVFVAHCGGASFGAAGRALLERNLALLDRLHPDYAAEIAAFQAADPLAPARRRLDRARFLAVEASKPAVVLITHDHGGGIARVVAERLTALREEGYRPVLLQPDFTDPQARTSGIGAVRLSDQMTADYPNLRFNLPQEWRSLRALLRAVRVQRVEFHHDLGHHPLLHELAAALAVPVRFFIHDYGVFCKRFHLIGPGRRYCGEPNTAGCERCLASEGSESTDPIAPAALRARSARELRAAEQVIVPSSDVARRLRRHFPTVITVVQPWQDDHAARHLQMPRSVKRRVAVLGGIGPAKGFDVLRDCALDAATRNLALDFVLVGASERDSVLLETGRVRITGPYPEGSGAALAARMAADLAFIPSIWPETWCFVLTEAWCAGLHTVVFDLGAQADRVRASRRGMVLPLGLSAGRINDALLAWRPELVNVAPIRKVVLPGRKS